VDIEKNRAKIRIRWDVKSKKDIEEARRLFLNLTRQGWLATYISKEDGKRRRALKFISTQGELYFIPLSEGG